MTSKEYLTKILNRFGLSADDVDLILINQGIEANELIDVERMKVALYEEFSNIIPLANVSEGGFSVSWNMEAIKLWYSQLSKSLGRENVLLEANNDEIEDVSWRW